jgi:prepilin-type processing-associated H-X9-DG protein
MYAADYLGRAMPLAYTDASIIGDGPPVYWWGTNEAARVDHRRGFVWPYLASDLKSAGVYECPDQPWGSYAPQGAARDITSTYGYNGYYLSPPHTPGWSWSIGKRPWRMIDMIPLPQRVAAFADTLIYLGGPQPHNTALLDPPYLYAGNDRWNRNTNPTTAFRHSGRTMALFVDGHAAAQRLSGEKMSNKTWRIGSVTEHNDPFYVPDWRDW